MQRERLKAAAAPRDSLVGVAVGSSVGRAVASEENCARFTESQGVIKEPDPLTTGLTHGYNSDFPPEVQPFRAGKGSRLKMTIVTAVSRGRRVAAAGSQQQ